MLLFPFLNQYIYYLVYDLIYLHALKKNNAILYSENVLSETDYLTQVKLMDNVKNALSLNLYAKPSERIAQVFFQLNLSKHWRFERNKIKRHFKCVIYLINTLGDVFETLHFWFNSFQIKKID